MGSLDAAETLSKGVKDGCEEAIKAGIVLEYPGAASIVDYSYMVFDYGVNIALVGKDQASREAIVDLIVYQFFNGKNFTELGDRTVSGWIENRVGEGRILYNCRPYYK